ncbi:MAG: type II toxin-antitoxin system HicB family antitoxin [Coxiellaceae bacterium]|nr:type II toxin-antitoxin system HicB family antitoxin [Coxiellaceae bacterium]
MNYAIVIFKDKTSDYSVSVPDIPGVFSAGSSYQEAIANAKEAIECHIEGLLIDCEPVPIANPIDNYINDHEYKCGTWALVDIDLSQLSGKAKRINITLPERVLRLMDSYAKNHNVKNRSALIAEAALSYMANENWNGIHKKD